MLKIETKITYMKNRMELYIYIYIYIIRVFVITKSFCGYVSNQVQYDMESTQYLGYIHIRLLDALRSYPGLTS